MEQVFLAWLTLSLVQLGETAGGNETCLSCPARFSDVPCTHVQKCSAGQLCDANSLIGRREAATSMTSRQNQTGFPLCERCCSGTICNINMCGQAPIISVSGGPTCYSCSNQITQNSCMEIQHCPTGQVCQLVPKLSLSTHKIHFESSCALKTDCEAKIDALTHGILGRKRDMPCSMRCCNTTLCNKLSCGHVTTPGPLPMDCKDIINRPHMFSNRGDGVYTIMLPRSHTVLQVFCDMTHDSGGWTVFQRRVSRSPDFNRSMAEYKKGFGNILSDFWIGLELLKEIADLGPSDEKYHAVVVADSPDGQWHSTVECHVSFRIISLSGAPSFTIARESSNGTISCASDQSGFPGQHYASAVFPPVATFATYDRDTAGGCAGRLGGGWWYYGCVPSNKSIPSDHLGIYNFNTFEGFKSTCGSHFYPGVTSQLFDYSLLNFTSGLPMFYSPLDQLLFSMNYIDMMIRRNN